MKLMAFRTNASGTFQKDHWFTLRIYLTTIQLLHFPKSWKAENIITLWKLSKDPKFP
jgi:hypothetical protein